MGLEEGVLLAEVTFLAYAGRGNSLTQYAAPRFVVEVLHDLEVIELVHVGQANSK